MKALAITHKGIEDAASLEINELLKSKTATKDSCVIFEVNSFEEIALICYKAQSVKKILYLIDSFKIKSLGDIKKSVAKNLEEINKLLKKTFAIRTEIQNNELDETEVCISAAEPINAKVNLENPDLIIFIYINKNDCYLGIDFSGEDLSKRDYRIYAHHGVLRAIIDYSLLRAADYKKTDIILDPFCGSGTILIEAALFSNNISPNYFSKDKFAFLKLFNIDLDKFDKKSSFNGKTSFSKSPPNVGDKGKIIGSDNEIRYIVSAKKNAKIAGVDDCISFERIEIDFLDKNLDKKSVDKMITNPPNKSHRNEKTIEKLYNDFFEKANHVLKNKGTITLITKTFDLMKKSALNNKFKIVKEKDILIGKEKHKIITFKK